jgi:hypothetical protein
MGSPRCPLGSPRCSHAWVAQMFPGVAHTLPWVAQTLPGVARTLPWVTLTLPGVPQTLPGAICLRFYKTLKVHQYGCQIKGLDLGNKNMLFIFRFFCLFTFRQLKQLPMVAQFFKGYA